MPSLAYQTLMGVVYSRAAVPSWAPAWNGSGPRCHINSGARRTHRSSTGAWSRLLMGTQ